MEQGALIERISAVLAGLERVESAFLGGSHGRGEEDPYSDVDVYAVVADAGHVAPVLGEIAARAEEIAPILYSKELPNARTVNCIATDWRRFDLTVVTAFELPFVAGSRLEPLFDGLGVLDGLRGSPDAMAPPDRDTVLDIVHEFIRVMGLSVVVHGRDDLVVAQTGTNLLRDLLIRIMVVENGPGPRRGVLALGRALAPDQRAALLRLPAAEANWAAVFERTRAIAGEFFPRARAVARRAGAEWPEVFERVTREHLEDKLGLGLPHPPDLGPH